ncbi:MAG: hypothetical protein LBT21_07335 [Oscillospiraceae bacterium]|nr:hypothetical protein [Oscillospiraceae bacterium]
MNKKKRDPFLRNCVLFFLLLMAIAFGVGGILGHNNVLAFTPRSEQTTESPDGGSENKMAIDGAGNIVCIGDSLMLGATPQLLERFPDAGIDAQVGRFMEGGVDGVLRAIYSKKLPQTVVIALATNISDNSTSALEEILVLLHDVPNVIFLTGYGTARTPVFADAVRALPKRGENIRVADWEAIAKEHPEYIAGDGIHLNGVAANEAYAQCIAQAVDGSLFWGVDGFIGT